MNYFKNKSIALVALDTKYTNIVFEWTNNEQLNESSGSRFPTSFEQHKKWLERTISNPTKKKLIILSDNKPVGMVSIFNIDQKNKNAEVGVYISPKYMGKSFASLSLKMVLEFAFKELNLIKIYANIHQDNIPSVKLFEKLGFEHEFTNKKIIFKKGTYIDILNYTIFNPNI